MNNVTNIKQTMQPTRSAPQLFNDVFKVLRQICPAATATIKTDEELNTLREQWVRAFAENGICNMDQINAGLAEARRLASPFLPSPGQFIEWCQQGSAQRAGLPTAEQLYSEFLTYCKRRGAYDSAEVYPWKSDALYWLVTDLYLTIPLCRTCHRNLHDNPTAWEAEYGSQTDHLAQFLNYSIGIGALA